MIHSPEQIAFFSALKESSSSLLLSACAGSGKTSTIVHGATLLPQGVLTVFLAFNKRIAEELEKRLPPSVQTGTFHSRAFRALSRSLPKHPKVDGDKIRKLLKANLKWEDFSLYSQFVCKLVSLAKSAGVGTNLMGERTEDWRSLIVHHGLTLDSQDSDEDRAINIAQKVLTESNSDTRSVDFDDMLYLALLRKAVFDKASFIFVDEAQDTNGVQRELLKAMGNFTPEIIKDNANEFAYTFPSHSRLIAVGDPHQAIYGFRGADASAMERLKTEFSMTEMPLSVSWRCSKAVVREAQKGLK